MSDLKRVVSLCSLLIQQEQAVAAAESSLKAAKEAALRTKREDLPNLMQEFGLSKFNLEDGTEVSVKEDCDARITEANREEAHAWLIKNGFGGLIKTEVVVEFGRGDQAAARKCAQALSKKHDLVSIEEVVHPQTLKAFVREQLSDGKAVPLQLFSVTPFSFAKITLPKSTT